MALSAEELKAVDGYIYSVSSTDPEADTDLNPFPDLSDLPDDVKVDVIEELMRSAGEVELPVTHNFADGIYSRTLYLPAGSMAVGKIHKTEHISIIASGAVLVWTEAEGTHLVRAPHLIVVGPGARRVGIALEDTVWITIHGTHERDLDKLEEQLIEPRTPELPAEVQKWLEGVE